MTAPTFAQRLLRYRRGTPNIADKDSATSVAISEHIFRTLKIPDRRPSRAEGAAFEAELTKYLDGALRRADASKPWIVRRGALISDYAQYGHLAELQRIIDTDLTNTLGVEIGRDYLIRPDVVVALDVGVFSLPFLHAAVSCKWTMRSDRVQNVRHEGRILTRHRRGRQPHIVTVTAEPLPTRLASLARGTGEVDAVYHVLFDELQAAVPMTATAIQEATFEELVGQRRVLPFADLVATLLM